MDRTRLYLRPNRLVKPSDLKKVKVCTVLLADNVGTSLMDSLQYATLQESKIHIDAAHCTRTRKHSL